MSVDWAYAHVVRIPYCTPTLCDLRPICNSRTLASSSVLPLNHPHLPSIKMSALSQLLLLLVVLTCHTSAANGSVLHRHSDEHIDSATQSTGHTSAAFTLHNPIPYLASMLDIGAGSGNGSEPVWLLGCMAGFEWSLEMIVAGQGPFRLQFDTGSDSVGVLSTLCSSPADCGADLGDRLNVSRGVDEGRLLGPHGNTTLFYGNNGFAGPLYDAAMLLPGMPRSLNTAVRLISVETAWNGYNSSIYCPYDTHSEQHDFSQGIVGVGRGGTLTGQGDTQWALEFFAQHPQFEREFTYELCPMHAGQLWMGRYEGDEQFMCSPVIGSTHWELQLCDMSLTSSDDTSSTPLGNMSDFGTCAGDYDRCAVLDTGVPFSMVPQVVYDRFVAALRTVPAYVAAFGEVNDPYDPSYSWGSAPCVKSPLSVDELRRQLPTIAIQVSNSSALDGNGTCNATHALSMPGVDGYLSRYTAPGGSHPLYCATLLSSATPIPGSFSQFSLLGDSFMQTHLVRHVYNNTAEEAAQICFATSTQCTDSSQNKGWNQQSGTGE